MTKEKKRKHLDLPWAIKTLLNIRCFLHSIQGVAVDPRQLRTRRPVAVTALSGPKARRWSFCHALIHSTRILKFPKQEQKKAHGLY
jgi:hypothetical protein